MAKYTVELGSLVKAGFNVFDDSWNTFDPQHKPVLCDKILRHYWFNEIGAETAERFKHYLNTQLVEIMPYYNMLYESALWDLYPLYNQWVENTSEGNEVQRQRGQSSGRTDKTALQLMVNNLKSRADASTTADVVGTTTGSKKWDETDIVDISEKETTTTNYTEKTSFSETDNRTIKKNVKTVDNEIRKEDYTKDNKTVTEQDTKGTEQRSSATWTSDTPQGAIVNNQLEIDNNYLTRYEHSVETRQTTGHMDETVTANETFDGKTVTDRTQTVDASEKDDLTKKGEGSKKADTQTLRELKRKDVVDKAGHENTSENRTETTKGRDIRSGEQFSEGTTDNRATDTTANVTDTTTDRKQSGTTISKGNVNITRSELVRKYRDLYINIDMEIIRELASNFMGVF